MKHNKYILQVIPLFFFLVSCAAQETKYPFPDGLPQSEIIFSTNNDPVGIQTTFGLINADGSNRQEYSFHFTDGTQLWRVLPPYAWYPRWSQSGNAIIFSLADNPPNMRMIDSQGKMHGNRCIDFFGMELTTDVHGNVLEVLTEVDKVYSEYEGFTSVEEKLIFRYDLTSCEIVGVFSLPIPFENAVGNINEATNGLLAAFYTDGNAEIIMIYDPTTKNRQILEGTFPSLTTDGALLAYFSREMMLTVYDTETQEQRILDSVPVDSSQANYIFSGLSMPGWSPDNQWLVYSTPEGDIFKINVETREKIYLTHGWYPDWR